MDKLDRLVWAAGASFSCYGVRIGIRVSAPETIAALQRCLPPGSDPIAAPGVVDHLYSLRVGGKGARKGVRHFHQLYADATRLVRTFEFDDVLRALESHLEFVVAAEAQRGLFVHAGVVGWRGRAIIIPGSSGSGKTSLVTALVRAGATYYSDEYGVLDAHARVHPFPRPLLIPIEPGRSPRRVSPADLGADTGEKPLPVGLIVVTQHRAGTSWRPRSLSPGQAFLALLRHTVAARTQPDRAFHVLRDVVSEASAIAGRRGDAATVAREVLKRAESAPARVESGRGNHR